MQIAPRCILGQRSLSFSIEAMTHHNGGGFVFKKHLSELTFTQVMMSEVSLLCQLLLGPQTWIIRSPKHLQLASQSIAPFFLLYCLPLSSSFLLLSLFSLTHTSDIIDNNISLLLPPLSKSCPVKSLQCIFSFLRFRHYSYAFHFHSSLCCWILSSLWSSFD